MVQDLEVGISEDRLMVTEIGIYVSEDLGGGGLTMGHHTLKGLSSCMRWYK